MQGLNPYGSTQVFSKTGKVWTGKANESPSDAWWQDDIKQYAKSKQINAAYDAVDQQYAPKPVGGSGTGTNQFGGDWTQGNQDFSFDKMRQDMMQSAKEMSAMQLDHTKQMMGTASHYRNFDEDKGLGRRMTEATHGSGLRVNEANNDSRNREREYTGKTTDDMRRDNQQSIWQQRLQESNQGFQERTQKNQFGQEKQMFQMRNQAETESTRSARQAADNLFNRGSSFRGR